VFFEDYRYSEDLDFTAVGKETVNADVIQKSMERLSDLIFKQTGIEINAKKPIIDVLNNNSYQEIIQIRIYYCGHSSPASSKSWPKIKLDIRADEIVTYPGEKRKIIHPYSDHEAIKDYEIKTYDFYDLLAEKIRALFERTRPRDLYDVVEICKRSSIDLSVLKKALKEKCTYKNTQSDLTLLKLESCEAGWQDQLSHQIRELPTFNQSIKEFNHLYVHFGLNEL